VTGWKTPEGHHVLRGALRHVEAHASQDVRAVAAHPGMGGSDTSLRAHYVDCDDGSSQLGGQRVARHGDHRFIPACGARWRDREGSACDLWFIPASRAQPLARLGERVQLRFIPRARGFDRSVRASARFDFGSSPRGGSTMVMNAGPEIVGSSLRGVRLQSADVRKNMTGSSPRASPTRTPRLMAYDCGSSPRAGERRGLRCT